MILLLKKTALLWLLSIGVLLSSAAAFATDKALLDILLGNGLI